TLTRAIPKIRDSWNASIRRRTSHFSIFRPLPIGVFRLGIRDAFGARADSINGSCEHHAGSPGTHIKKSAIRFAPSVSLEGVSMHHANFQDGLNQHPSRRRFLRNLRTNAAAGLSVAWSLDAAAQPSASARNPPTPEAALDELTSGNQRFVTGHLTHH